MHRPLAAAIALTLAVSPLAAQRAYAPAVLQLPSSTRALGMADAFPLGSTESDALFYNLALSQNVAGITAGAQRWGAGATLLAASGAAEWWGGRIAIGVQTLGYDAESATVTGELDEAALFGAGAVQVSERVAAVGYTRRIKGLRVGLVAKAVEQRREGELETTAAFDLSTGIPLGVVNIGLAVQNVGLTAEFDDNDVDSPLRVTLAAATSRAAPFGPLDVLPAVSLARTPDGTLVPAAGVEVGYWPIQGRTFFARAGLRRPAGDDLDPFTLGAGFQGDRIAIDWAWASFDDGSTHRLSLRWR
jgi:hypothetical protein